MARMHLGPCQDTLLEHGRDRGACREERARMLTHGLHGRPGMPGLSLLSTTHSSRALGGLQHLLAQRGMQHPEQQNQHSA